MDNLFYMCYFCWVSLLWGIVCLVLVIFVGSIVDIVIEVINKVGFVFYGFILVIFLLVIVIKCIYVFGVNIGIIVGVVLNFYLWLVVGNEFFWFWWNVIGFLVIFGLGYLVSLVIKVEVKYVLLNFVIDWLELKLKEILILLVWFVFIVVVSVNLLVILS